jgi:hypothetical protein
MTRLALVPVSIGVFAAALGCSGPAEPSGQEIPLGEASQASELAASIAMPGTASNNGAPTNFLAQACPALTEETAAQQALANWVLGFLRIAGGISADYFADIESSSTPRRAYTYAPPAAARDCGGIRLTDAGLAVLRTGAELAVAETRIGTRIRVADAAETVDRMVTNVVKTLHSIQQLANCEVAKALKAGGNPDITGVIHPPGVPDDGTSFTYEFEATGKIFDANCAQYEVFKVGSSKASADALKIMFGRWKGQADANPFLVFSGKNPLIGDKEVAVDPTSEQSTACSPVYQWPNLKACGNPEGYEYGGMAHTSASAFMPADAARVCEPCKVMNISGTIRDIGYGVIMCDPGAIPSAAGCLLE